MKKHRLERLESQWLTDAVVDGLSERREWAVWECSCGVSGSGYRFQVGSVPPLVQAANEWMDHCGQYLVREAFKAGGTWHACGRAQTPKDNAPDEDAYVKEVLA